MLGCSLPLIKSLIERSGFFYDLSSFCGRGSLFFFNRPAFRKAWSRMYWIWPLVLRNSSAAQASISFHHISVHPRMKLLTVLSFGHILVLILNSYINDVGPGIYDRLRCLVSAKDHQQVANHRSLPFLIQFHNIVLIQFVQGESNHADRSSTIRSLAAIMASACWRRNMTPAISEAYAK